MYKHIFICLLIVFFTTSCFNTCNNSIINHQVPESLIIDADTATVIPAFQKEIGDAKVICYIIDSCRGKYDGKEIMVMLQELGNSIISSRKVSVMGDSLVLEFPNLVGTANIQLEFPIGGNVLNLFINSNENTNIWIDTSDSEKGKLNVYSDNEYNAINHIRNLEYKYYRSRCTISPEKYLKKTKQEFVEMIINQQDSLFKEILRDSSISTLAKLKYKEKVKLDSYYKLCAYNSDKKYYSISDYNCDEFIYPTELSEIFYKLNFVPQWLLKVESYDGHILRNQSLNLKNFSREINYISQLVKLCAKFENEMWSDASENAADFIEDDFCKTAYKHYRDQGIMTHSQSKYGVYKENFQNKNDDKILSTIITKFKGKRIIIEFWGTNVGMCIHNIQENENIKDKEIVYVYITCQRWSEYSYWNRIVNDIIGYHYFISDDSFDNILEKYNNPYGVIPYKLYVSENGKISYYKNGSLQEYDGIVDKNLSVYVEKTPNVSNDVLLANIVERYKGKPIVIDFWGTTCIPCMMEIKENEDIKKDDINYIYISCKKHSSRSDWEQRIKDISGHHYYISSDSFTFLLKQFGNNNGSIPFKLYFSADGKLEKTQIGYKPQ